LDLATLFWLSDHFCNTHWVREEIRIFHLYYPT
jgi:hypothetical protein